MSSESSELRLFPDQESELSDSLDKMGPHAPLARRVAPQTLEEFVGQDHLIGPGRALRRAIESDCLTSLILHGPPGVGKTALARIIARRTQAAFATLNAVTSGVAEVRKVIQQAKERAASGRRTILFIDEIHRFNRAQQDALLPAVEAGDITLIGATTFNPFFAINSPLLSRSQIFEMFPLTEEQIRKIIERAREHPARGFDDRQIEIEPDAIDHLIRVADGDARRALADLELAILTTDPDEENRICVTCNAVQEANQRKAQVYDGTGDEHYDIISAFIKSLRGSNPDAALYWMALMFRAGEDPRFIARRIAIAAAEDVGNADPMALVVANSAVQMLEFIGMPEGRLVLAQAAIYIASAPKSNASTLGIGAAMQKVESDETIPVPSHLRDAHYPGAKRLGRGQGYTYPHDFPGHFVPQDYGVAPGSLYHPADSGLEKEIRKRLEKLWGIDWETPKPAE